MHGRLGNQLFQYAFARWIQEKTQKKMIISFFNVNRKGDTNEGWENSLKYFNVGEFEEYKNNKNILISETNIVQKIICSIYYTINIILKYNNNIKYKFQKSFQKILNRVGVFYIQDGYAVPKIYNCRKIIVNGHFEDRRYFDEISSILKKEFTPKFPINGDNKYMLKNIIENESICISVRRGDFLDSINIAKYYICNEEYFKKGIEIINQRIKKAKYFIFSDDIEWVKKNMKFDFDVTYESGKDPIWEKLYLMKSCKHFILSNSTFSWWAQYLSDNKDKIVICPKIWNKGKIKSNLIENKFIKI
jgi:hypothetical protein